MTLRKHEVSKVRAWLLCWFIQFTGFIICLVQYNSQHGLYDMVCQVNSLKVATDATHYLRVLLTSVVYPVISFILYKSRPSPLLIGSGCLSVAVVCALMGWSASYISGASSVINLRGNSNGDDSVNTTLCTAIYPSIHETPLYVTSIWDVLLDANLLRAVAVQVLLVYGVAVHFVAGVILVENINGENRSGLILAFLLMALNSAPYIGSYFTPIAPASDGHFGGDWISVIKQGWIPLGVTSLFLTPLAFLTSRASQGRPAASTSCQEEDVIEQGGTLIGKGLGKEYINSLQKLLVSHLVLCNVFSQLLMTAGIAGIDQIQTKLTELSRTKATNEDSPMEEFLLKYSAHFINYGPNITLFITGVVIFKLRPHPRRLLMWSTMTLVLMLVFVVMWTRSNEGTYKVSLDPLLESCRCLQSNFTSPLCSEDGLMYTSTCQAGCSNVCTTENRTQYFNVCSLLTSNVSVLSPDHCPLNGDNRWDRLLWFLYIFIVVKSLVGSGRIIGVFVSIRSVSNQEKPISLALVLGVTTLITILDRENLYAQYITELTCLALVFTFITWHFIKHVPLYESHSSLAGKHKSPFLDAGKTNCSGKNENSTLLHRESLIDESELLDARIMSRQRDSIDVTKSKRFRVKRLSLGYRKRSMPNFEEHVVYP